MPYLRTNMIVLSITRCKMQSICAANMFMGKLHVYYYNVIVKLKSCYMYYYCNRCTGKRIQNLQGNFINRRKPAESRSSTVSVKVIWEVVIINY